MVERTLSYVLVECALYCGNGKIYVKGHIRIQERCQLCSMGKPQNIAGICFIPVKVLLPISEIIQVVKFEQVAEMIHNIIPECPDGYVHLNYFEDISYNTRDGR